MPAPFAFRLRVRYGECDAQKVVFNARYADYVDIAQTEFLRAIGYDYATFGRRGLDFQVVKLVLEWQDAARFDDVVEVRVRAAQVSNTSFTLDYQLAKPAPRTPLCHAQATYVLMTVQPFAKTRVPDDLRAALEGGAPGIIIDHAGAR